MSWVPGFGCDLQEIDSKNIEMRLRNLGSYKLDTDGFKDIVNEKH